MVEVHLNWQEASTTVGAWTIAKPPQEFDGGCLAAPDALDLTLSIRGVPANVRGTLIAFRGHGQV